jgi:hypothetical protein
MLSSKSSLLAPLLFCHLLFAGQWIRFDFSDRSLNPANSLEGPVPRCQSPSETVDEVSAGDWIRGPGLSAVYLPNGFGAAGWTGPDAGPLRYEHAVRNGMYLECSISSRPQHVLQVIEVRAYLRHVEIAPGRLAEFEWQWSVDDFLFGPQGTQRFCLADATALGRGIHRLPVLNFADMGGHPPLTGFQRLTVRLYVWDGDTFNGPAPALSIIGLVQPPAGDGVGIRVATRSADPFEPDMVPPRLQILHIQGQPWLRVPRQPGSVGQKIIIEESPDNQSWRPHLNGPAIDSPGAMYFRVPNQ